MSSFALPPLVIAALETFKATYPDDGEILCAFAPGRVNLIGEHVDYNDGFVLPFALPFRTVLVGRRTNKSESSIVSTTIGSSEKISFVVSKDMQRGEPTWANYVKGTIFQYVENLPEGFAFDAVISSDVPLGSGLSSSASLEVATATFIEHLAGLTGTISGVTKALRCQKAEHEWADTPCGIMDQYISALAVENNLLLIDCRTNSCSLVPFGGADSDGTAPVAVVTNSNVKHTLSGSEYPDRVRQCRDAVSALQSNGFPDIKALRDADLDKLNAARSTMSEVSYKRAKHCVMEDTRTLATVKALEKGDFDSVGRHMTASHMSLKNDFEVSCPELDLLVEIALTVPGVLGSRMTGGGFGGCTVTLLTAGSVEQFKKLVGEAYRAATGVDCVFYEAVPSAGAGTIILHVP